jgi:hypothetical protein
MTAEVVRKFVPLTVMVVPWLPAAADDGLTAARVGAGLEGCVPAPELVPLFPPVPPVPPAVELEPQPVRQGMPKPSKNARWNSELFSGMVGAV